MPIVEPVGFIALGNKEDYTPWTIIGHLITGFILFLEKLNLALAGLAQWIKRWPVH